MHPTQDTPRVNYVGDTHMDVVPGSGVSASVGVTVVLHVVLAAGNIEKL